MLQDLFEGLFKMHLVYTASEGLIRFFGVLDSRTQQVHTKLHSLIWVGAIAICGSIWLA